MFKPYKIISQKPVHDGIDAVVEFTATKLNHVIQKGQTRLLIPPETNIDQYLNTFCSEHGITR